MVLELSNGSAAVIISAMAIIAGILNKFFGNKNPEKQTNQLETFFEGMKSILISQNDLGAKQTITLALMEQKVNGSHEKLNFVSKVIIGVDKELHEVKEKVDDIWKTTA